MPNPKQENFINRPAVALGLPKTPIVPFFQSPKFESGSATGVAPNMTVNDYFKAKLTAAEKSSPFQSIPVESFAGNNRYDEVRPGTNFEELAAQQQSTLDKWGNASVKFLGTASSSFASGTVGVLYGILAAAADQRWASLVDNDVTRGMSRGTDYLESALPNYYKQVETNADWYSPNNLLTANFWSDKVFKNLGYSLGAMGGGVAWGSLFKVTGLTNSLVRAGVGMEAATAVESAMANAPNLKKYGAIEEALTSLSQKYLKNPTAAMLKNSDRILTSAMGTFGEAALEGYQNMNEFKTKAIDEYINLYGVAPTGKDLEDINNVSDKIGMYTWGFNTMLLTGTNYLQLPKILNSSRKADKALINEIAQEKLGKDFTKTVATTKFGKLVDTARGVGKVLFAPSEAFEEGSQYAIQVGVNNYFERGYKNKEAVKDFFTTFSDLTDNVLGNGYGEALSSKEGLENILIGGLSGGLQQAGFVGTYRDENTGKVKVGIGKGGVLGEQGLFGLGGERGRNTEVALTSLNKTKITDVLKDGAKYVGIAIGSQQLRQEAIVADDKFSEKDYEADYTFSYLMPRAKYGKMDSVKKELEYYKTQAMSDEGFDELIRTGIVNEKEKKEEFLGRLATLEETAKSIDNLYTAINDKYENTLDDKGKQMYSPDIIDKLVYASSKIRDYENRMPGINNQLLNSGVNSGQDIINEITLTGAVSDETLEKVQKEITDLGGTDDDIQDRIDNVVDLIKAANNRKQFINEYNDIRSNPTKYVSKEPAAPIVEEKGKQSTSVIKTKGGTEKLLEIGKKYYSGAPMRKSEEGVIFQDFSQFTYLGETEDGKLRLQTVSADPNVEGEIYEVDKSYFEKHELGDIDSVKNKPNFKFYIESAGKVFSYQLGGGEIIKGTIRYSRKNDRLQFVSTDGTRKFNVTREDFKAKKGFKQAKIFTSGSLTARQQEALDEKITEEEIKQRLETRNEIVAEVANSFKEKLAEINSKLDKAKEDLAKKQQELNDLSLTKDGKPRKGYVGKARKLLNTLRDQYATIQETITSLEDQKEEVENTISYLQETYENEELAPENYKDILKTLREDVKNLKEIRDITQDSINSGKSMLQSIAGAIETAMKMFNSFISDLKRANPNLPLFLDDLQNRLEKYLGEEGAKQYIADKLGFTELVAELQDQVDSYSNELNLPDMTNKSEKLKAQLAELENGLNDITSQQKTKEALLDKFNEVITAYEEKVKQEAELEKNPKVLKELRKTADKGVQTTLYNDEDYEQDPKKATLIIPVATKAPSEEFAGKPLADHHVRANSFGARMESFPNRKNLYGVEVTKKNQDQFLPGLVEFLKDRGDDTIPVDIDQTIAVIIVEEDPETGNVSLVDVNGKPIDPTLSNEEKLERAIFQTRPLTLTWSNGDSMFRKETDKEVVEALSKQYQNWRDETLENPKSELYEIQPSFGVPILVTYLDENGDKQIDTKARTSVQDAGLIDNNKLLNSRLIEVPTKDEPLEEGTVRFEEPMGKPFLILPNGYVKLKNRKLTRKEAETVYAAIERLAKNLLNDGDLQSDSSVAIVEYLRSIVYWGTPREGSDVGQNSIFFDAVVEEGIFETIKLFVHGEEQNIKFSPSDIRTHKPEIIALLENTYNNVNSKLTGSAYGDTYKEVTGFTEEGELQFREWPNYQSYLLSDRLPGEEGKLDGAIRDNADIPLVTQLRPLTDENDVNREGIYFVMKYPDEKFIAPDVSKKANKRFVSKSKKEQPVKKSKPSKKSSTGGKFKLDGVVVNKMKTAKGNIIFFKANLTLVRKGNLKDGIKIVFNDSDGNPIGDASAIQDDMINSRKFSKEESIQGLKEIILDAIKKEAKNKPVKKTKPVKIDDTFVIGEDEEESEEEGDVIIDDEEDTSEEEDVIIIEEEEEEEEPTDKEEADKMKAFKNAFATASAKNKDIVDDELASDLENMDDDVPFRLAVENQIKQFEGENWQKVEKWLKANFFNVPVYRVKNIIKAINGKQAWGMFKDGAIYIYENAEIGTVYHEVFHAIWRMATSPEEQQSIFNEFRSRKGTFIDSSTLEDVNYSEATDAQIEEKLAEEFRDYVQYKKIPARPTEGRPFIVKLFADLVNFIKEFFTGEKAQVNTANLFDRIGKGYYKTSIPFSKELSYASQGIIDIDEAFASDDAAYSIANFSTQEVHDIMQEMTYQTLVNLTSTNKGLFELPSINKAILYKDLRVELRRTVTKLFKASTELVASKKIEEKQAIADQTKSLTMRASIMNDAIWNEIVAKHEDYLKKYNIEFDENDNIILNDENSTGRESWQDARKIDSFRKSNPAIKLLLSTIPIVKEVNALGDVDTVKSSIGGVTLLPTSEVFIKIMNKVHTSRNIDEMLLRIKKMAEKDPNYRKLYYRLTRRKYTTPGINLTNLQKPHDLDLLSAMWGSFRKQNPNIKNFFILDNGDVQVGDGNFATAARQAKIEIINGLIKAIKKDNKYFTKEKNSFVGNPVAVAKVPIGSTLERVNFLKSIGITFKKTDIDKLSKLDKDKFKDAVYWIKDSIAKAEKISTIGGKVLNIEKRLMQLAEIKSIIDNPEFDSTYFGVDGERKQTYIGINAASNFYDMLSQIDNLKEIPELYPEFAYLLTDSFVNGSVILNKMFDVNTGEKRETFQNYMEVGIVDGTIDSSKNKSRESSKLTYRDRFIQELNLNLAGYYTNLVPGDASIEWLLKLGNAISAEKLASGFTDVYNIFEKYFYSELELSREDDRPIVKIGDRKSTDLRFFKGILGKELHDEIVSAEGSVKDVYKNFKDRIDAKIKDFINTESSKTRQTLIEYDVISKDEKGNWNIENIDFKTTQGVKDETLMRYVNTMTVNYMIANIELHKLLYSDPYQYSDELKRIKNFNSPRQALVNNSKKMNGAYNSIWNSFFDDVADKIGNTNFNREYFRTAMLEDISGKIDLPNYKIFTETDGSGIITFKGYRNFRIRSGSWTKREEAQFMYDVVWEKLYKGQSISDKEMKIYEKGNPKVKSAYTPLKPIVSGNKNDGKDYNDVVLDKFALYPLSFRLMYDVALKNEDGSVIETNTMRLYNKMQKEDIDYVVFESGRKVGGTTANTVYNNKGEFITSPYEGISNIPFSIMSVQAEVPSKDAPYTTRGSQVTKLLTLDYMQMGIPIDYMVGEEDDVRYNSWNNLNTDEERFKESPLYEEIKNNEELLSQMIEVGYQNLLKEFGIKEVSKNEYVIDNIDKVANLLNDELLKREVNDNIISAIEGFKNGDSVLEATPAYQIIRNIIYSIADREVISQKMPGGMKVQIPSTLIESVRPEAIPIKNKKGETINAFSSNVLKFYEDADGKRVCEIMIARWFKSNKTDEELMNYFNNTDEGKAQLAALSGVAFRIPTQKQNSIDAFIIAKFLPEEFGDSVIVPAAIVEKSGTDFDIDKLSMYLKNVIVDKSGYPKLVQFLTDANSTVEQRYIKWVADRSNVDTRKYIKFLTKNIIKQLRSDFSESFNEIEKAYPDKLSKIKNETYNALSNLYDSDLNLKLSDQDSYIKELFDKGANVFFSMTDETREDYWALKDSMRKNNVSGPTEIKRYLSLTLAKLEDPTTISEDIQHLSNMAKLYEEELRVMGVTEEFIKEYKKIAINNYRKEKNSLISALNLETSKEITELNVKFEEEKENIDLEAAFEIAERDELSSFEDFKKMNKYQQNTKKALENAYIQSSENLISNKLNFERLIVPNSADQLKELSSDIAKKTNQPEFDYSSTKNMLSRDFMSKLRHAFVSGKYAIGIAAVNQTNHSLNQRSLIYIDLDRLNIVNPIDKVFLGDGKLKFFNSENKPNFNTIKFRDKIVTTLSMIKTKSGDFISDILGQFIDGYVDIAKGPWIMQLGATPNVASTFMFLVKAGVPIKTVAYFMNQPIIRDYLRSIETSGYTWLFNTTLLEEIKQSSKYKISDDKINEIVRIPSDTALYNMLGKEILSPMEKTQQQFILNEFLKYAKLAEHLFHITQGSNFDTANFNDYYLIYKKEKNLEKAQSTIISSVDDVIDNSFLKVLRTDILKMGEALSTILISDKSRVRKIIQSVIDPYINNSDRDFVKIAQKAVNDLFDWAVQTDTLVDGKVRLNSLIEKALLSDNNYVDQISEFVDTVRSDPNHELRNNQIIKILQPIISDKVGENYTNNLKIRNKDNKTYDQNQIIGAFNELKDYLKGENSNIYNKLVTVAILQSGLSNSPISFTSIIPYADFKRIYNSVMSRLETVPNLEKFAELNVFQRNNWNDDDLVPLMKAKLIQSNGDFWYNPSMNFLPASVKSAVFNKVIPEVMTVSTLSREGQADVIVYQWEDESYSISERKAMRSKGDYSFIKRGLFKKVKDDFGVPYIHVGKNEKYVNYVYKAINAWGDSYRANEFYKTAKQSKINNGFIKVTEVDDNLIIPYFTGKESKKSLKSKEIKPKGRPVIKNRNQNNCG